LYLDALFFFATKTNKINNKKVKIRNKEVAIPSSNYSIILK